MNARFFVVKYRAGDSGCPPYLSGELNRDEWEWPMYVADPFGVDVKHEYIFTLSDSSVSIDFDFYGAQTNYVSKEFLVACEKLGVRYRAIPISIVASGKPAGNKVYSIFLPADHESLLDRQRSNYSEDRDLETKEVAENKLFPGTPMYSWIKNFIPRDDCASNLFRCTETMELVCSQEFKSEVERCALKGIEFLPIDESYSYDPWGEAP
ncbi:Imm43 family immunity protein [Burkholderia semiarida]|uniref:Imm43 family immunity protein n=1 Tax=Burkholderia semiarida TaxID=2843303 RepID=UPI0038783AC6